jgi:hypothetical protein
VLLHSDAGGPQAAARTVLDRFGHELDEIRTTPGDLLASFATPDAQGPLAYVGQMAIDHSELDPATLAADAAVAVETFHAGLTEGR